LRANKIKIDPLHDFVYFQAGGGVLGAYRLSSFKSRLGEPLTSVVRFCMPGNPPTEQYLSFDMSVNAERRMTDWQTPETDGQYKLVDFDFDARGYIYLAYSYFGFGIVDLQGKLIAQVLNPYTPPAPFLVLTFEDGAKQYLLVSDTSSTSAIYDVTDPSAPVRTRTLSFGVSGYAKADKATAIAIITNTTGSVLQIYTPAELKDGGTPDATIAPDFNAWGDVTSDGTDFYAMQGGNPGVTITSIVHSMAGYTKTNLTTVQGSGRSLTYRSGYLAYVGQKSSLTSPPPLMVLYAVDGATLTPYDVSPITASYTQSFVRPNQMVTFCTDTGSAAMFAIHGLGDVYGIADGIAPCATAPPTNVTATRGDASATITFGPPASDGGSAVTSYIVRSEPATTEVFNASSPVTMKGLTNGTTYTFAVVATNAAGATGAASNTVVPFGPPAWVNAQANGSASVDVSWQPVGAAQYDVWRGTTLSNIAHYTQTTDSSFHDPDVQPDTAYLYAVQAVDAADVHSASSVIDFATTFDFTPIAPGMTIAAAHIIQLKDAVNAVRVAAERDPIDFTTPVHAGAVIAGSNVNDLTSALNDARIALGVAPSSFFGNPAGYVISTVYLDQIRNNLR
jgi:hypothetical protein